MNHWKVYVKSVLADDCMAGFAKRIGLPLPKARKIAREIVRDSKIILTSEIHAESLGIPDLVGCSLRELRRERRVTREVEQSIAEGVYTLEEYLGIADIDCEETAEYVPDGVKP